MSVFVAGIRWKTEARSYLQNEPFSTQECEITIHKTCQPDYSDIFSVPIPASKERKKDSQAFVMMILTCQNELKLDENDVFQSLECPMTFSTCSYNWCITGENRLVSIFYP
jgi:hypothetical protein